MDLYILFGQRKEEYEEQCAPEALICWDEYCMEENPGAFEKACDEEKSKHGSDFVAFRVIRVEVDQAFIRRLLLVDPRVKGVVKP